MAVKMLPPTILVVDDSKLARAVIEQALIGEGPRHVVQAESVGEALAHLGLGKGGAGASGRPVDLILLDIMMPDMDGIDACRLIKGTEAFKDIPIIMVTSRDDTQSLARAFEAGAMDYLTKPIVDVELKARVNSALALKAWSDQCKERERELLELTARLTTANQKLRRLSAVDGLTGASNRRFFDETMIKECRRARREKEALALLMIDIDYFKPYNDRHGHLAGDDCLKNVVKGLASVLHRPGDLLARYGGEEFAVILPGTGKEGALIVAEAMRSTIEGLGLEHGGHPEAKVVTVSLGVAAIEAGGDVCEPAELIDQADKALYRAKQSGRNQVVAH